MIISKAVKAEQDSYSGFETSDLEERLRKLGAQRLFIGGLATDYCVLATVTDALALGFTVFLLVDAIRAVGVQPGDGQRAEKKMRQMGAQAIRLEQVLS